MYCPYLDLRISATIHDWDSIFEAEAKAILYALVKIDEYEVDKALVVTNLRSVLSVLMGVDRKGNLHTSV